MKKICFVLITILLVIPISVSAANKAITSINATVDGATINYTGTIEAGAYAVMCKLYTSSNEEIDLLSSAVTNDAFEGSFTVAENGDYKVSCADYDGGDISSTTATVTEAASNPNTGDKLLKYVCILIVGCLGIFGGVLYLKRNKKDSK